MALIDLLATRPVVIALALAGAACSVAASAMQARGWVGAAGATWINRVGYVFMGVSMALFIVAGYRGGAG